MTHIGRELKTYSFSWGGYLPKLGTPTFTGSTWETRPQDIGLGNQKDCAHRPGSCGQLRKGCAQTHPPQDPGQNSPLKCVQTLCENDSFANFKGLVLGVRVCWDAWEWMPVGGICLSEPADTTFSFPLWWALPSAFPLYLANTDPHLFIF